jgi:hypothetical protein
MDTEYISSSQPVTASSRRAGAEGVLRCMLNVNYLLFSVKEAKQKTQRIADSDYNAVAWEGKEFCQHLNFFL